FATVLTLGYVPVLYSLFFKLKFEKKNGCDKSTTELRKRALKPVGKFHSGLGDLSEKHDDYLAEGKEK
ncbi:MAG: hypothetical protein U9N73_09955, partial [Candidatus Auribacterota bacterium]|nr:hypothetical protein [Candidatus Auribacterota bacterium]